MDHEGYHALSVVEGEDDPMCSYAQRHQMSNSRSITQSLLLAFAELLEQKLLHFWLFLGIYLVVLLGNGLILTTIACDYHLHTPMYFFLLNLSLLDLAFISSILPKSMSNPGTPGLSPAQDVLPKSFSLPSCLQQSFLF